MALNLPLPQCVSHNPPSAVSPGVVRSNILFRAALPFSGWAFTPQEWRQSEAGWLHRRTDSHRATPRHSAQLHLPRHSRSSMRMAMRTCQPSGIRRM